MLLSENLPVPKIAMDTEVAAYLLNPSRNSYALQELMAEHANISVDLGTGTPDGQLDFESDKSSNSHASTLKAITIALL